MRNSSSPVLAFGNFDWELWETDAPNEHTYRGVINGKNCDWEQMGNTAVL
jgi:hypothetical protein